MMATRRFSPLNVSGSFTDVVGDGRGRGGRGNCELCGRGSCKGLLSNVPHRSNRIIRNLGRLHGGVPTDDEDVARLRLRRCPVSLQPFALDQVSFGRNGPLQVLSRKIHQSHSRLQLLQNVARLTDGIKDIVNLAMNLSVSNWDVLRRIRDRGQVEMMPASLLE